MSRVILVGAGDFLFKKIAVLEDDFIIAVDGGYENLLKIGLKPHLLIGDMDSLKTLPKAIKTIKLPSDKDDTDMFFAVKEALKMGFKEFVFYGATGKRFEHTYANLQVLKYLADSNISGVIKELDGEIRLLKNKRISFSETYSGYISVFAFEKEARNVSMNGFKYQVENITLKNNYPLGIDNEFLSKKCYIEVQDGILLIINRKMS